MKPKQHRCAFAPVLRNVFTVLGTPILSFFPQLDVHHVVAMPSQVNKKIYIIDYTPIDENAYWYTLMGYSVKGKIRITSLPYTLPLVRLLCSTNPLLTDCPVDELSIERTIELPKRSFVDAWYESVRKNMYSEVTDATVDERILSYQFVLQDVDDPKLASLLAKWDTTFNLYTHNCRHFSHYLTSSYYSL
jgi:hypothetical protein